MPLTKNAKCPVFFIDEGRLFLRRVAQPHHEVDHTVPEFVEMPGLSLTPEQAQRLWALEREVCDGLLTELVTEGFLARSGDGAFLRRTRSSVR